MQSLIEFERDGNHNEKSRCGENVYKTVVYRLEYKRRNKRDYRKEYRSEKRYSVGYSAEIVRSRLARAGAGDKSAVTLNTLAYVVRIELYLIVEIRKEQYQ